MVAFVAIVTPRITQEYIGNLQDPYVLMWTTMD